MTSVAPIAATPLIMTALALVLAGPAPARLARATWPSHVPRAALVLWQSLALAALLAALGAGLSVGTLAVTDDRPGNGMLVMHIAALAFTLIILVRLLWSAHTLGLSLRARRRRHRELIDLVSHVDCRVPGARVLDARPAFAYCVPGLSPRLVVSSSVLDTLDNDEIRAVLEHERAHTRARHDLVLEGFTALHNAFPRLVRSRAALDSAAGLVEMLADDAARRRTGARSLGRALTKLADGLVPTGAMGSANVTLLARIQRLARPSVLMPRGLAATAYTAATAILVLPTVTVATPWLVELSMLAR